MSRKFILRTLVIGMLYVAAASYIFQNETRFFYHQEALDSDFHYDIDLESQELKIPLNEETSLNGLWIKNKERKAIILYFPGGNYQSGDLNASQQFYFSLGYDLIIPDYRSSGKSTGTYHSEEDLYLDGFQWLKMTKSLSDSLPIIVVGQEFGSGIAAKVYTYDIADFLILEEPYNTWSDIMLRKYFWWLPYSYFTNFEMHSWKYIRASSKPIVLIHPTESKNIDFKNSELLLEYLKPGDQLITINGDVIDYESKEFKRKIEEIDLP